MTNNVQNKQLFLEKLSQTSQELIHLNSAILITVKDVNEPVNERGEKPYQIDMSLFGDSPQQLAEFMEQSLDRFKEAIKEH